jgi:hypothetical protein
VRLWPSQLRIEIVTERIEYLSPRKAAVADGAA